jgi:hypothetical protein
MILLLEQGVMQAKHEIFLEIFITLKIVLFMDFLEKI